jgi:putative ABC transport system substrate-binding protein
MGMKRRDVVGVLGGAIVPALLSSRPVRTQPKLRTVGFLGTGTPATQGTWLAALVQRMHELNWIDGRTIAFDVRWAEGRSERYTEIGAEFVRRKVDVIVTSGGAVPALMKATSDIPIVFGIDGDPVGRGLVASLARPGGNVTGLSALQPELAGKRLELLREMLPQLRRMAVMGNAGFAGAVQEIEEVQTVGGKLGIEVLTALIRRPEDIAPAFDRLAGKVDALYVCGDALATSQQRRIRVPAH